MSRVLTGIQSTGIPHLGNILGAIRPGIELSEREGNQALFFIADLHSLTSIKDPETIRKNTLSVAAAWLAFGFDTEKNIFYRQSDIPQVCEFTWYLSCFTPYPMLANAHSFKDKSSNLKDVNAGLFTYPVLMASDILMYDADFVPVGKDQRQHLEMTRDIAGSINHQLNEDILVLPEGLYDEKVMIIPGIDGRKMSKSYGNTIDIFLPDKKLKKVVNSVVTDSTPMEEPKDPDTCNVFAIYKTMATDEEITEMRANYTGGNYGYGHAKKALYEKILEQFGQQREAYWHWIEKENELEDRLQYGADKARKIALEVLSRLKNKLGYGLLQTS